MLILINCLMQVRVGNVFTDMVIRLSKLDGWFGKMIIWFCFYVFLRLVLVLSLDSKIQFLEHVTWLNSMTMRSARAFPAQLICFLLFMLHGTVYVRGS